jgi:hypothetical protein
MCDPSRAPETRIHLKPRRTVKVPPEVADNGPGAMEEPVAYDDGMIVGVLHGAGGTTRDTRELLARAKRHGARLALVGRKIN